MPFRWLHCVSISYGINSLVCLFCYILPTLPHYGSFHTWFRIFIVNLSSMSSFLLGEPYGRPRNPKCGECSSKVVFRRAIPVGVLSTQEFYCIRVWHPVWCKLLVSLAHERYFCFHPGSEDKASCPPPQRGQVLLTHLHAKAAVPSSMWASGPVSACPACQKLPHPLPCLLVAWALGFSVWGHLGFPSASSQFSSGSKSLPHFI